MRILGLLLLGAAGSVCGAPPSIGGCALLPADNPWNTRVDAAPVDPQSDAYIANIDANGGDFVHPDFGASASYGIPWTTVGAGQAPVPVSFQYADESDPGPYPIPPDAPVESGSDHHVLIVDTSTCLLYELYGAQYLGAGSGWHAGSGAVWDLQSNALRPNGWTSADAAGLPILPGLARCDEASSGVIDHALRFTVSRTRHAYAYPASHYASSYAKPDYPPMGLRLRLKASYDTSALHGQALAIATALKTYGMILADNGSNWFISGETNPACWNDTQLNGLKLIPGTAFEAVVSPPPPSDVAGDLLADGGFEAGRLKGPRPLWWSAGVQAARACDDPQAGVYSADAGQCMARIIGADAVTTRLQQLVTAPPSGALRLTFRARQLSVPAGGASAAVVLAYTDGTTRRYSLALPGGSSAKYQSFLIDAPATRPVASAQVTFTYTAPTGRLWLDRVALVAAGP